MTSTNAPPATEAGEDHNSWTKLEIEVLDAVGGEGARASHINVHLDKLDIEVLDAVGGEGACASHISPTEGIDEVETWLGHVEVLARVFTLHLSAHMPVQGPC